MRESLTTAEQELDAFLPVLRDMYPEGRTNTSSLKQLVDMYEGIVYNDGIMVALYDHRTASVIFMNKNSKQVTGYDRETVLKWGGLLMFKALHYSHYSYVYTALRLAKKFDSKIPIKERKDIQFYCCGLKMRSGNGKLLKAFIKSKVLLLDKRGQVDVSIFFGQDVSHLLKGTHYWTRLVCKDKHFAHVQLKGKKEYKDILSKRELEIVRLIADKKPTVEIAKELNLSTLTVETHRKNMIKRTGAIDSTALIHLCKLVDIL